MPPALDLRQPGDRGPAARRVRRRTRPSWWRRTVSTTSGSPRASPPRGPTARCSPHRRAEPTGRWSPTSARSSPVRGGPARRCLRPGGAPATPMPCWCSEARPAGGRRRPSAPSRPPAIPSALCARATCPTRPSRALLRRAAVVAYPGARGGVRAPRPRGVGLRRPARDHRGHRHGGNGGRCGAPGPARRRRRAGRRAGRHLEEGRATARRSLGLRWRGSGPGRPASRGTCARMPVARAASQ